MIFEWIMILGLILFDIGMVICLFEVPLPLKCIIITGLLLILIGAYGLLSNRKYQIKIKEDDKIVTYEHCTNVAVENKTISFNCQNKHYKIFSEYIKAIEE